MGFGACSVRLAECVCYIRRSLGSVLRLRLAVDIRQQSQPTFQPWKAKRLRVRPELELLKFQRRTKVGIENESIQPASKFVYSHYPLWRAPAMAMRQTSYEGFS